MDSLTQLALGAAVGTAVLGRRIGPRRAAIAGGVLGTLPDLDVLYAFDDPIDAFTLHRGATHSLVVQALVTPLFGEALVRLFEGLRDQRLRTYLAVYLVFATHAVLDALTIYGTRLFWPIYPEPLGAGSIFIIDPLYTLPLLMAVIWALFRSRWSPGFGRSLAVALVASTAYLGWGLVVQQMVKGHARDLLAQAGVVPDRLLATPTAFNTLLWKVIAVDGDRYLNLYLPVSGDRGPVAAFVHPRGTGHLGCLGESEALDKLAAFSKGFYRLDLVADELRVSDLRMGLTPNYVFSFAVAAETAEGLRAIAPQRRVNARSAEGDVDWLLANLGGAPMLRPAEAAAVVDLLDPLQLARGEDAPAAC
ncbi:MAG: metal-dependent hydrolase [Kiloniellaceae bacterium]